MNDLEIPSRNLMKAKMDSGEVAVGMIVRLMRGVEIAAIAKGAGFDSLYIDLEHCSFSLETVSQISMTAVAMGVTPLVRVAGLNKADISRTLETGAQGIIVPHVENRSQAEEIVEAAKFPPKGDRSLLGINAHTLFKGGPAAEIMEKMNQATLVVAMIESVNAVENADEIASVDGIDMLLVGTNDLCNSLEIPGEVGHQRVLEAYDHVAAACRMRGKHLGVGGLNSRPEIAKELIAKGARYVSAGSDTGILMAAATATARAFR
ncbi:2-keto-3-deoxy-L-rhamnonate aldolase RhmA [Rhizobium sp. SLBN-94]|nr:2-keto-3-deoxy-L-rhamnonate aldolase RhmA [Rhizobium sp. SLBN-94]